MTRPAIVWKALTALSAIAIGGAVISAITVSFSAHHAPARVHQARPMAISPAPAHYKPETPPPTGPPPLRLLIPAIGVDAPVSALGLNQDYTLEAPAGIQEVGWYRLGPAPGVAGDAIISGHRGYPGGEPAVFNHLDRLKPGDKLEVRREGAGVVQFEVSRVFTTGYRNIPPELFAAGGPARVTLLTCTGDFDSRQLTYADRLVVEATQVPPPTN